MSTAAKLKKRAIELEQKKQVDKALALYIQFLQESDGTLDDVDIPLYNRVGDLLIRAGNTSEALNHYEKAIDLYAERGFHNNAIALCNKVLRQAPGRASIYYKLGRISATKGFKSDAKKNFLEYADRMQKVGQIDEAFRALKEFADLCPDQDDIRLMLAEQLSKENRQDEALEQLQKLHDKLDGEGRTAEARATVDRMKSIDPEAIPRTSGSHRPQKSSDLIFLDTSFDQPSRSKPPAPSTRQVSDPDLVVLTLGDQGDTPVTPLPNAVADDRFLLDDETSGEPVDAASPDLPECADLPLLDVSAPIDGAGDSHLDDVIEISAVASPVDHGMLEVESFDVPAEAAQPDSSAAARASMEIGAVADPPAVDLLEPSAYVSGAPLGVDYAADLVSDGLTDSGPSVGSDLFDFRAPPRSDEFGLNAEPAIGLDPDVAFPSFDLNDMALPSADEVTSGASLTAALGVGESLGTSEQLEAAASAAALAEAMGVAGTETIEFQMDPGALLEEAIGSVDEDATSNGLAGLELGWPGSMDVTGDVPAVATSDDVPTVNDLELTAVDDDAPTADEPSREDDSVGADTTAAVVARTPTRVTDTPARIDVVATIDASEATPDAVVPPSVEETDPWLVRRARAEQLLETGSREAGIEELVQLSAELDRAGDLERALTIVDELIRLSPDSVRHHQKRVELAFRASDRPKLIDAYIELGDALFRSGEERKAHVVYQRVLELAPDDARARAALESVASASPPNGSETIAPAASRPAVPSAPAGADHRTNGAHAAAPHTHDAEAVGQQPTTRGGNGVAGPAPTRKPSPLDRSAANGDFVDLGDWIRASAAPRSTRMITEEKPPTGDEQADFQEMLKRFKQGVADNVDEEDHESHYDLGVAYKEMGLIEEAVAEFQKALRGTAHRVRTYEALGQCFVEKEQYQVASSVLGRAMALGDGDDHHLVGVLYLMGRATEALNRPTDALDYYQRVFAVDIEFRDVADRISAIERKAT